ncbi:hypothetical protein NHH73_06150 [Oxalobacteraceae bacterium OTU3CINTB1]|nr:hypothetical protein NHH73_06150 [Oxalobacteraceae bacterium OTU3CINTB1]
MTQFPVSVGSKTGAAPDCAAESEALASSALTSVAHVLTTHRLAKKYAASMANNGALSLSLATRLWDPEVWNESMQLQAAILRRLQAQGQNWRTGCTVLLEDYGQLRQANTMSKLLEKQCNLSSQFAQLLGNQATDFVALLENIDVDYGYWASQKTSAPSTAS